MATKTAKTKGKDAAATATATAVVTGKGNPGPLRGIAARTGRKAKAPPAPSSAKGDEVTVDAKLPGHDAIQAELKERQAELERRISVYKRMAKNKTAMIAKEAERLTAEAQAEQKEVEAELGKSGLLVDEWIVARKEKGDAEKRMGDLFLVLGPILEAKRIEMSRARRTEISSMAVNGAVKYIAGSVITGLTGEKLKTEEQRDQREAELREVFGDRHDEFILRKKQMSLNMEILEADPDFAGGLFEVIIAFCEENGKDPCDVVPEQDTLLGLKALVTGRVLDPKVQELFDEASGMKLLGLKAAHLRKGKE